MNCKEYCRNAQFCTTVSHGYKGSEDMNPDDCAIYWKCEDLLLDAFLAKDDYEHDYEDDYTDEETEE